MGSWHHADGADHADLEQSPDYGERTNSLPVNVLGWIATTLMFAAAIALIFTWRKG